VYLSSTPVVGTVRQVFTWLLVQCTVAGVFVQCTSRGNSTTSIHLAPCRVHSYWYICPVHQSWEQYDKYFLGCLCSLQLLVYLSSTPVVATVRQVFSWLLVESTVTGIFVKYTSRGNSRTSIPLAPCTEHSYWYICPVHQSWEQYDKYFLGSLCSLQLLAYLSSTPVVATVRQVFTWLLVECTVTGVLVQYTNRKLVCLSNAGCSHQPSMSLASPSPQCVSAHRTIYSVLFIFLQIMDR
jgi:hypothetical protein